MAVPSSTTEGVDGDMAAVTGIKINFKMEFTSSTQEILCDCIRAFLGP